MEQEPSQTPLRATRCQAGPTPCYGHQLCFFIGALLGALLLFPAPLHAQNDPLYEDWRWVHFTTASGLPSNTIINVVETTEGVV